MRSLSCPQAEDWQTPVARHHYSLGAISLALAFVLNCRGSLRGSTSAIGLVCSLLGQQQTLPGHTSVRSWLLRVGLHQLTRPLEQADDDWIWIVDHTVQIGELKCLIILGLRHSAWLAQEDRTLEYENVDLIDLVPVRTSTGEVVNQQLEAATGRTGVPQAIISDDGRDLHRGLALFRARHPTVEWLYDIKHKTANLLKHELERDPEWTQFSKLANEAKRHVHQTELAFCNPPQQRGKARYMSVDTLVAWGLKVLVWLDDPKPTGRALDPQRIEAKLGWLRTYRPALARWKRALDVIELVETTVRRDGYHADSEQELRRRLGPVDAQELDGRLASALLTFVAEHASKAESHKRLPGSSEVLESVIGKYKTLQGESGHSGVTGMLLSIGAVVGKLTIQGIRKALETITGPTLQAWEQERLGPTVQSQRRRAFHQPKDGTKPGTNPLPSPDMN
jgi:hypothetical protein